MTWTDKSIIIVVQRGCQRAGSRRRQRAAPNRWDHQTTNQRIRGNDCGRNRRAVRAVRYIELRGNQLMRERYQSITLRRRIKDRLKLQVGIRDRSECQRSYRPNVCVIPCWYWPVRLPVTLSVGAIGPRWLTGERRALESCSPVASV